MEVFHRLKGVLGHALSFFYLRISRASPESFPFLSLVTDIRSLSDRFLAVACTEQVVVRHGTTREHKRCIPFLLGCPRSAGHHSLNCQFREADRTAERCYRLRYLVNRKWCHSQPPSDRSVISDLGHRRRRAASAMRGPPRAATDKPHGHQPRSSPGHFRCSDHPQLPSLEGKQKESFRGSNDG